MAFIYYIPTIYLPAEEVVRCSRLEKFEHKYCRKIVAPGRAHDHWRDTLYGDICSRFFKPKTYLIPKFKTLSSLRLRPSERSKKTIVSNSQVKKLRRYFLQIKVTCSFQFSLLSSRTPKVHFTFRTVSCFCLG